MNSTCVLLLTLALFGAFASAYVGPMYSSGCCGGYGIGYGAGYGGGMHGAGMHGAGMYGGASVCDTCQCVKTVVRPPVVERIPYSCNRRVQTPVCGTGCGVYPAGGVGMYSGAGVGGGLISGGYGGYAGGYGGAMI